MRNVLAQFAVTKLWVNATWRTASVAQISVPDMAVAVGERFVRRHNASRGSTSNTTAADIAFDTAVFDEGDGFTYNNPDVEVDTAGLYLNIFDLGHVDHSGSSRDVGTLVPRINGTTDQVRFRATHRYLRDSGGAQHGASIGMAILDLSANDDVRTRNPGALAPTDAVGTYATNVSFGGAIQLLRLPANNLTHVERTSDAAEVGTSNINATRPWLDSSGTWTTITYNSEVRDDDSLYSGSGGTVVLAADKKYLIVWGAACYSTDTSRHCYVVRLQIDGNNVQTGSGYHRNAASQGPPMCGMYLHETGGSAENCILQATHETEGGDAGTPNVSDAYLQVFELNDSTEWIHVDNGTTDSLTTALAGTSTWYDTPLGSTFRADGDSNLSLDSGNDAVQNDAGETLPILAIGWHRWDRDSGSSGNRKNPWTRWDNGGANVGYGIGGAFSRGQQSSDDNFQAHYCSASLMDLADGADLSFQVNDEANASNSDMGVYNSTSRYFLGVQVLNLNTLEPGSTTYDLSIDLDADLAMTPTMVFPPEWIMSLSSEFTDGAATTRQLNIPSGKAGGDFDAGDIVDVSNPTADIDIGDDGFTEIEWAIEATSTAKEILYEFRVVCDDDTLLDTYTTTPSITISSGTVYNLAVALGIDLDQAEVAAVVFGTAVQLDIDLDQLQVPAIVLTGSVALPSNLAITAAGQTDFATDVTFAVDAAVIQTVTRTIGGTLTLSAEFGDQYTMSAVYAAATSLAVDLGLSIDPQIDLDLSLVTLSIDLDSNYVAGLSHSPTVSLPVDLSDTYDAEVTFNAAIAALSATLGLANDANITANLSVPLGIELDETITTDVTFNAALALVTDFAISQISSMVYPVAVNLNSDMDLVSAATVTLNESTTLAIDLDQSATATVDFDTAMSIGILLALVQDSALDINVDESFGIDVSLTLISGLSYVATITLPGNLGLSVDAAGTVAAAVSLGLELDDSEAAAYVANADVNLDADLDIGVVSDMDIGVVVDFDVELDDAEISGLSIDTDLQLDIDADITITEDVTYNPSLDLGVDVGVDPDPDVTVNAEVNLDADFSEAASAGFVANDGIELGIDLDVDPGSTIAFGKFVDFDVELGQVQTADLEMDESVALDVELDDTEASEIEMDLDVDLDAELDIAFIEESEGEFFETVTLAAELDSDYDATIEMDASIDLDADVDESSDAVLTTSENVPLAVELDQNQTAGFMLDAALNLDADFDQSQTADQTLGLQLNLDAEFSQSQSVVAAFATAINLAVDSTLQTEAANQISKTLTLAIETDLIQDMNIIMSGNVVLNADVAVVFDEQTSTSVSTALATQLGLSILEQAIFDARVDFDVDYDISFDSELIVIDVNGIQIRVTLENRLIIVRPEVRRIMVEPSERSISVLGEQRGISVPGEGRLIIVPGNVV